MITGMVTLNRRVKKLIGSIAFLAFLLLVSFFQIRNGGPASPQGPASSTTTSDAASSTEPTPSTTDSTTSTNALVIRAVDGDTLRVVLDAKPGEEQTVRLLGVDTPESVDPRTRVECFGKQASEFTASQANGKRVRLEEDLQADNIDRYNRLLRNIILEDGRDLNALLVREGYAHAYVTFPMNKQRKAELQRLQDEAREAKRGLWNPETCGGMR
jgi:micrococcal nuclease